METSFRGEMSRAAGYQGTIGVVAWKKDRRGGVDITMGRQAACAERYARAMS